MQLRTGHIEVFSDGSYFKTIKFGAATWVIKTSRTSYKIISRMTILCGRNETCSLLLLQELCQENMERAVYTNEYPSIIKILNSSLWAWHHDK